MCTAISYSAGEHYFGRTLDLEYTYGESVTVTPRKFPFFYRADQHQSDHYAIIGIAAVMDGYPLYYDAVNEYGLCMAGLNFTTDAVYHPNTHGMRNLAPYELIPWILGCCKTVAEAREELKMIQLTDTPFRADLPSAKLHWMISDGDESIVAEPMADGLHLYANPVGVLTNHPAFPYQMEHLTLYRNLSPKEEPCRFSDAIRFHATGRGMGAIGLPGDLSSTSRFVRAAFTALNASKPNENSEAVSQCFHILGAVEQTEGCVRLEQGLERSQYTVCVNADRGIYYCKTYRSHGVMAVSLRAENLDGNTLRSYPLIAYPLPTPINSN
ncbi:MAG: choloylglycine hydrolase [Clostridia bacterium]|nr:choloylglycine hydrolase [Clostridia bacterium]